MVGRWGMMREGGWRSWTHGLRASHNLSDDSIQTLE